MRKTAL